MDKEKKKSIKEKIEHFFKDIWRECKDKKTLCIFLIVVVVMYSPVWLCGLLYFIFKYKTFLVIATAYLAFWAGPATPFFPLCIAITLGIKKMLERREKKLELLEEEEANEEEQTESEQEEMKEKKQTESEQEEMKEKKQAAQKKADEKEKRQTSQKKADEKEKKQTSQKKAELKEARTDLEYEQEGECIVNDGTYD